MKIIRGFFLSALLAACSVAQTASGSPPTCAVIDKSRDSVFVSFERVERDSSCKGKNCEQVVFRLQNNSTCPILITTADEGGFFEPLPSNATFLERIKRKPTYDLPNGVFMSSVCYSVQRLGTATYSELGQTCGGDVRYEFRILGSRSVLFGVDRQSIQKNHSLYLPFSFAWEREGQRPKVTYSGDVEHRVFIHVPEDVYRRMKG